MQEVEEKNVGNIGVEHKYLFTYKTMDKSIEQRTQKVVDSIQ
jgi:hypothetical protein